MRIIDAHAHIFRTLAGFGADGELRMLGDGRAMWATGDEAAIIPEGYGNGRFTAESLLRMMDENGIGKAVLLQGGLLGFDNHYMKEAADRYPERLRAAAAIDPFCRNRERILHHLADDLGFRIFKFEMSTGCGIMGNHPDFPLDADFMMGLYGEIDRIGGVAVFDLGSPGDGSSQPDAIRRIAERLPGLQIVICHLMSPRRTHREELIRGLRTMDMGNIAFDISALHWKVRPEAYPFPTAKEFIRIALDILGPGKLMWGSDAPSTVAQGTSIRQMVDYVMEAVPAADAESIFCSNAEKIYFGG